MPIEDNSKEDLDSEKLEVPLKPLARLEKSDREGRSEFCSLVDLRACVIPWVRFSSM